MTPLHQIWNWLEIAFGQSINNSKEDFFYDKRDSQFFSTLLFDYFLFDDDFKIAPEVTTTFSNEELIQLADRLKRIQNNSEDILAIPKLTEDENEKSLDADYVLQKAEKFLNINSINLEIVSIWETEGTGSITFKMNNDNSNDVNPSQMQPKPWWKIW